MTRYLEYVYERLHHEIAGLDSVYEDYIIKVIGEFGLYMLRKHKLLETCGVINGRQLYVLCDKEMSYQ